MDVVRSTPPGRGARCCSHLFIRELLDALLVFELAYEQMVVVLCDDTSLKADDDHLLGLQPQEKQQFRLQQSPARTWLYSETC